MKSVKLAFVTYVLLWLLPLDVSAADFYVDITNNTGYTILYMYVSPEKSESWEEDVLGDKVLADGETRRVNLYGYKRPTFDIRLVDEDDDSYTFLGIDVTKQDIIATISDID
jgi:hypothetical protein